MKTVIKTASVILFASIIIFAYSCTKPGLTPEPEYIATSTVTAEFTGTDTPQETASSTWTITETASPSCTHTETLTDTDTETITQTVTATATATVTQTATATFTITSTFTADRTATELATQTAVAAQTSVVGLSYTALVSVPGGTFTQTNSIEAYDHTVSAFSAGKYEVTYEVWYTVYQWAVNSGYHFANMGREGNDGIVGALPTTAKYEPVTTINWRDAIVWCNAYSEMTEKTPFYYTDASFTVPLRDSKDGLYFNSRNTDAGSFDNPYINPAGNGYRLLTEGEWECAARYINGTDWLPYNYASGATADFTDTTATGYVAWYSGNSGNVTHDEGGKDPNASLMYDMPGNVWEWCLDWMASYPTVLSVDYSNTAPGGMNRIGRGGACSFEAANTMSGNRYSRAPYFEGGNIGLRVAR